jgi:cytosine/adenosine deaminase-related metal-dependent hydrolase
LWRDVRDASHERRLLVHTHVAESPNEGREVERAVQATAARYFDRNELLGQRFVGAHGVWLEPDEIAAIARTGAALAHCPGSNLKLGSGLANVRAWLDAGIRCGLGSDGAACNNRLDTFHEMSLASGISRVRRSDAPLSAREVLHLATRGGAQALGWDDAIGSLEPGKQADLVVIDGRGAHAAPDAEHDPYVTIVEALRASDVRLTMVAGRVLYRDGAWSTLDPERVVADAHAEARGLMRRAAA